LGENQERASDNEERPTANDNHGADAEDSTGVEELPMANPEEG